MALELIKINSFPETINPANWLVVADTSGTAFKISQDNLKAWLGTVTTVTPRPIKPSDPAPTLDGVYIPTVTQNEAGTPIVYTIAGGLTVNTAEGGADYGNKVELIRNGSVWVKSSYPLPKADSKIEDWNPESTYFAGRQVLYNGKIFEVPVGQTAAPSDIPGISPKWGQQTFEPTVNDFPNNGNFLHWTTTNTAIVSVVPGYYRFAGSGYVEVSPMPAVSTDRYIAVTKGIINSGSPVLAIRSPTNVRQNHTLVIGNSILMPAGYSIIEINAGAGGSIDIAEIYIGDKPYSAEWVLPIKENKVDNYFQNTHLEGLPNVVSDGYGGRKIRIMGNNAAQTVSLFFDKTNAGDYASLLYQSTVGSVVVNTVDVNASDIDTGLLSRTLQAHPDAKHVASRQFSAAHPRVRIDVTFTGSPSDWLEVSSPAITKSPRLETDALVNRSISGFNNLTSLRDDLPVNIALNGGDVKTYNIVASAGISVDLDYVRFTGTSAAELLSLPPTTKTMYFAITKGGNIVGTPRIGIRTPSNALLYRNAEIGRSYEIFPDHYNVLVTAGAGGSIDISEVYYGEKPYNAEWVTPQPVKEVGNYFPNQNLNGFPAKVVDSYGVAKLRLQGNGSEQSIRIIFDKTVEGDYASLIFKSSVNSVKVLTAHLNGPGGTAEGNISTFANVPHSQHIISRRFGGEDRPRTYIDISFTGSDSDYLEVYSPAITKEARDLTDKLVNKASVVSTGGIAQFATLKDALLENPSGLIQVGRNILTRKVDTPVLKSDYALVNSTTEPQKVAKLEGIQYVDLGLWRLMLVTTKKRFILCDGANVKYTDNINECLILGTHATEKRFTFDSSKLTQMVATNSRAVRELGNGELVVQTYNNTHYYTTDNQTVFNLSSAHPATSGSRIDGWAFDAYGDTVVFSTYAPAPARAQGSVILSVDGGRSYNEVFNLAERAGEFFPGTDPANIHLHGCFIDGYRESIVMVVGDYGFTEVANGKILVLENYRTNTSEWKMIPANFVEGIREQYCAGIALEKSLLFGTDMQETCIARMNISESGYNSPREFADRLHIGLDYIPAFTRPVEPGAPIGIHYSHIGATNFNAPPSSIILTKDGFNFANIYTDTVQHIGFANNNARVWCTVAGDVYCQQFNGRFSNELIIGKYNGFNMV